MIRDHYRNTENRKAELDPSTFDLRQPLTPADLRLRAWVWRALIAYVLAAFAVGIWVLSVLIEGVI
jgi:hypothetical protein